MQNVKSMSKKQRIFIEIFANIVFQSERICRPSPFILLSPKQFITENENVIAENHIVDSCKIIKVIADSEDWAN